MGLFTESASELITEAFNQEAYDFEMTKSPRGNDVWFEFTDEQDKIFEIKFATVNGEIGKEARLVTVGTKDDPTDRRSNNLKFVNPTRVVVTLVKCLESYVKTPQGRAAKGFAFALPKRFAQRGFRFMENLFKRSNILKRNITMLEPRVTLKNGQPSIFGVRKGMEKDVESIFTGTSVSGILGSGSTGEDIDPRDAALAAHNELEKTNKLYKKFNCTITVPNSSFNFYLKIGRYNVASITADSMSTHDIVAAVETIIGGTVEFYSRAVTETISAEFTRNEYGEYIHKGKDGYAAVASYDGDQVTFVLYDSDSTEMNTVQATGDLAKDSKLLLAIVNDADAGEQVEDEPEDNGVRSNDELRELGKPYQSNVLAPANPAYDAGVTALRAKGLTDQEIADAMTMNGWSADEMYAKVKNVIGGDEFVGFKEEKRGKYVFAKENGKDVIHFTINNDGGLMSASWRVLNIDKGMETAQIGNALFKFLNTITSVQTSLQMAITQAAQDFGGVDFLDKYKIVTNPTKLLKTDGYEASFNIYSEDPEINDVFYGNPNVSALDKQDDLVRKAKNELDDVEEIYGDTDVSGSQAVSKPIDITEDGEYEFEDNYPSTDISTRTSANIESASKHYFISGDQSTDMYDTKYSFAEHTISGSVDMDLEVFKMGVKGTGGFMIASNNMARPVVLTKVVVRGGVVKYIEGKIYKYSDANIGGQN